MSDPQTPDEVVGHYQERYDERGRLDDGGLGTIESQRTLELLGRVLPEPPARILDVGGGPGHYARRLAADGYEVHLIDPVPRHVEQASRPEGGLAVPESSRLGDARRLDHPDDAFDAVLLLGPLYHLTEEEDRLAALREALRVARAGAPVAVAAISRFAPAIDLLDTGGFDDPTFREIVLRDLAGGRHHNPTADPRYFTTAYLHHPDGLRDEMEAAGFSAVEVFAVEGVSWAARDLAAILADPDRLETVMGIVRATETDPALLGASPHLLAIGRA